jgi:hypothetical protein
MNAALSTVIVGSRGQTMVSPGVNLGLEGYFLTGYKVEFGSNSESMKSSTFFNRYRGNDASAVIAETEYDEGSEVSKEQQVARELEKDPFLLNKNVSLGAPLQARTMEEIVEAKHKPTDDEGLMAILEERSENKRTFKRRDKKKRYGLKKLALGENALGLGLD